MSTTRPHPSPADPRGSRVAGGSRIAGTLATTVTGGGLALVLALALVPSGPAGAATSLGGFTLSALAEGVTASYDQPNAPIPATPTVELDEGYAATSDNFGPTGSATASSLYPGQVIANAGPELGSFVPGVPLPAAPVWPVQAASTYPQTPNTASDNQSGVTMQASSAATTNTATAQLGNAPATATAPCATTGSASSTGSGGSGGSGGPGVPGLPSLPTGLPTGLPSLPAVTGASSTGSSGTGASGAGSSGSGSTGKSTAGTASNAKPAATGSGTGGLGSTSSVVQVQGVSGTSSSGTANSVATATATATDSCISVLGGLITMGSVTSTATATSDGSKGQVAGTTTVQNADLGGQPVTIDSTGIHAAGQSPPANPVLATLQQALTQLGISLTVTNATDTVNGPQADRRLDGLRVQINLTTFDKAAQQFAAVIPASVTAELPVPVPNKQVLVLDLATVDVQSTASPGFTTTAAGTGTSASTAASPVTPAVATAGTASGIGTTSLSTGSGTATGGGTGGTVGTAGTTGGTGTAGGAGTTGTGSDKPVPAADAASSVPLAFKGIGAGLILLGLLAAGILGYGSMKAGGAADALPGGAPCELGDEDPLDNEGGGQ